MFTAKHSRWLFERVRRLFAGGCAVLVLALTIFAASPVAHDLLHDADHAPESDACAVAMFADGVSLPVGPIALMPPMSVRQAASTVTAVDVFLISPRYLRQPERGPPVS